MTQAQVFCDHVELERNELSCVSSGGEDDREEQAPPTRICTLSTANHDSAETINAGQPHLRLQCGETVDHGHGVAFPSGHPYQHPE